MPTYRQTLYAFFLPFVFLGVGFGATVLSILSIAFFIYTLALVF